MRRVAGDRGRTKTFTPVTDGVRARRADAIISAETVAHVRKACPAAQCVQLGRELSAAELDALLLDCAKTRYLDLASTAYLSDGALKEFGTLFGTLCSPHPQAVFFPRVSTRVDGPYYYINQCHLAPARRRYYTTVPIIDRRAHQHRTTIARLQAHARARASWGVQQLLAPPPRRGHCAGMVSSRA